MFNDINVNVAVNTEDLVEALFYGLSIDELFEFILVIDERVAVKS